VARPTRLTDEVQERLVQLIEAGNTATVAAVSLGIGESTYYEWMRRGRKEKRGQFRRFYNAVKVARARGEIRLNSLLSLAAEKDWRAAAFYLERRNPKEWGQKNRLETTHKGDPKHPVAISGISQEQAGDELLRRLTETRERFLQAGNVTLRLEREDENH
jgi:transposase